MTSPQGYYTPNYESTKVDPVQLFVYNQPWNNNMNAPSAYASMRQMTEGVPFTGSNKRISWPPGGNHYNPIPIGSPNWGSPADFGSNFPSVLKWENLLGRIASKYEKLYYAILTHEGFVKPVSSRAGMTTNIVPSNMTLAEFIKTRPMTIFLPVNIPLSTDKQYIGALLNSIVKRKISPSEFGYKREQDIMGNYILLKDENRALYVAFSEPNTGGFNDQYNARVNWKEIKSFIQTTNGYLYIYDN